MRRTIQLLSIPLLVLSFGFLFATAVNAQNAPTLTQEEQNRVIASCVSVKSTINQLHVSDALLRVNRGQIYESMATNLMDKFNDRLSSNRLDNKAMTTVTGSYRTALTKFRTDYIAYEQKLSQTLRIDCATKPVEFYTTLEEARKLRTEVHSDVQKLHQYVDDYRKSTGDFLLNYERLSQ